MKDQIVSYETAILAKEKGFDIPVMQSGQVYCTDLKEIMTVVDSNAIRNWNDSKFINICSAPTQSLLQKWLRDIKDMWVLLDFDGVTYNISIYGRYTPTNERILITNTGSENFEDKYFLRYEHALEVGLFEALKLIEK